VRPVEIAPRINVDPEVCHGAAVVTGTRVMVWVVLEGLAGGMSKEEVADTYGLATEDVEAALAFATDVIVKMQVTAVPEA
jgi:uncharacterized protein (DUF433 family)